ncbi:MAG: S8 family serine peptidase [Alphaproteobacteria bacterium]|nr:S8 family serine peptidase [Alphaproteobacteria bacterium]
MRLVSAYRDLLLTVLIGAAVLPATAGTPPDPREDNVAFVRFASKQLCSAPSLSTAEKIARLKAHSLDHATPIRRNGTIVGWREQYRLATGGSLQVLRMGQGDRVGRWQFTYANARPELTAFAGPDCTLLGGRWLIYDEKGHRQTLAQYGRDLVEIVSREPLNPPIPAGRDPGGVVVALFDSGINYTLKPIARHLARAPNGQALGYDFWDGDARPFDEDSGASPFFPRRHGTAIAGLILREFPRVRLLPYRYPRPDMRRMADMVRAAESNGAVIVSMPMGSTAKSDWHAFVAAARARPDMLFVISAGNNGRDIDNEPVYPAAFNLENFLVVTSAGPFGTIAQGSNWGAKSVDLMVPAEQMEALDFDGRERPRSGSSQAVARTVAIAARLLRRHPRWRAPALKKAILKHARITTKSRGATRYGWIADPLSIK